MRRTAWITGAVVFVFAALLTLVLVTGRRHLVSAQRDLEAAQHSLLAGRHDRATSELDSAVKELRAARHGAQLLPARLLGSVPLVGSPVKAVTAASRAGLEAVDAGRILTDVVQEMPLSSDKGINGDDLTPFHAAASASVGDIDRATEHLRRARAILAAPSGAKLPMVGGLAASTRQTVAKAITRLAGARRGLQVLSELSAPDTDRRLLLLSQDSLELRPTGGFIGSFGVLHFHHGAVDLERYESFESLPPPDPPLEAPPFLKQALYSYWAISNVNWWPNFPTTAAMAREMFKRQGGGDVDGVVAITQDLLGDLVGVFEPVHVPGYDQPVVKDGFEDRVIYEVELKEPHDTPRKKFIAELAKVVFNRVLHLSGDDLPKVRDVVDRAVGVGDIQVWFADQRDQRLVSGSALSGALPHPKGDFLMLVDANMSASKANAGVTKAATYRVEPLAGGRLMGKLDVEVRNDGTYHDSLNPYYNGYLRVYTPKGSQLLRATHGGGNAGMADDGPFRVFSNYVFVKPGQSETISFEYLLPRSVEAGDYSLRWVRQVGTTGDRLTAVLGDHAVDADPHDRSLEVHTNLRGSGLLHRLRNGWVAKHLGL